MKQLVEQLIKDVENLPPYGWRGFNIPLTSERLDSTWAYENDIDREKVLKLLKDFQIVFEDEFEDQRREKDF